MRTLAIAAALLATGGTAFGQTTIFYLDSEPGDYIGQGAEQTRTTSDGSFGATRNFDNGVKVSFAGGGQLWSFDFSAPESVDLAPGVYEGATRSPFQDFDDPGLSVSGDGRGCNTLTGRFIVHEAVYSPAGDVESFAADFEQHCEDGDAALFGSVRFNSQILVLSSWVNEPGFGLGDEIRVGIGLDSPGLSQIVDLFAGFVLPDGDTVAFFDDTLQTRIGSLSDLTSLSPMLPGFDLSTSTTARSREFLRFSLPGSSSEGRYSFFWMALTPGALADGVLVEAELIALSGAAFEFPSYTFLYMVSEPGDFIGQGGTRFFQRGDGEFNGRRNFDNGVSLQFRGSALGPNWSTDFAAADEVDLLPGLFEGATRFPFQDPGEPGLSVSGEGRGCNTLTGRFIVHEAEYDDDGRVLRFAADFEQHCEGAAPALFGALRYNSTILVPNP